MIGPNDQTGIRVENDEPKKRALGDFAFLSVVCPHKIDKIQFIYFLCFLRGGEIKRFQTDRENKMRYDC